MKRQTVGASGHLRCAIYTRKSSEEGLEQHFNSLHAQREACEAYVLSQAGEGWSTLPAAYDDGGYSGGSMSRPGLDTLLADIDAGRIDVVVVYKVDRLTRSLADFAKIVERFDARGVSFVSVTQAFNTTSSMGRLTLNVLLSFAQFEREVTGERIRDKIAASKAKGMWMGGNIPLGYDAEGRALVVNPAEAKQVRHIFERYLALGSVHALRDELDVGGCVSKRRVTLAGKAIGGASFSRGALFHLLSNRHYLGEIVHKDQTYPGTHPAIVEKEVFEAAQLKLAEKAGAERRRRTGLEPRPPAAPLAGLVFDDRGNRMVSVQARKEKGRLYRYYVSAALFRGRPAEAGSLARLPGPALEEVLRDRTRRLGFAHDRDNFAAVIIRVEVGRSKLVARLRGRPASCGERALPTGDRLEIAGPDCWLTIPTTFEWRGGAKRAVGPNGSRAIQEHKVDLTLLRGLVRAEAWKARLIAEEKSANELAAEEGVNRSYFQRLLRLAFLAPDIKREILAGSASYGPNLKRLLQGDVALAWADQRRLWGQ